MPLSFNVEDISVVALRCAGRVILRSRTSFTKRYLVLDAFAIHSLQESARLVSKFSTATAVRESTRVRVYALYYALSEFRKVWPKVRGK